MTELKINPGVFDEYRSQLLENQPSNAQLSKIKGLVSTLKCDSQQK